MKVAFYGNVCNNYYTLAKTLRQQLNIEAHLYLNYKLDIQHLPESDDPSLKNNYPDWIHLSKKWDPVLFIKKLDRTFIRELNKYDIVFLSEFGIMLAPYIKATTLFYVTGGDLTQMPFPGKFAHKFKNIVERIKWEYFGFHQRRGIKSCTKILTQPFSPFVNALNELRVPSGKISKCYFPVLIDTNVVKQKDNALDEIDEYNKNLLSPFKFIILHPSRINMDESVASVHAGQWKGNDKLLKALDIFIRKYNVHDICIAMPDRIYSPDIPKAKKLISSLQIEKNIVWLKPPVAQGFTRKELMNFYSLSDIVADEFATGWFGSIVIEGTACSKPTFCYVDEEVMQQLYPWHPIISVLDPADIAEKIALFYFDEQKKLEHGELSKEWAVKFHSISMGTKIYLDNFNTDLSNIFNLA
jgi:hypothetical protein